MVRWIKPNLLPASTLESRIQVECSGDFFAQYTFINRSVYIFKRRCTSSRIFESYRD
ncbi:MAG: hypothetical protein P8X79_20135 [Reinekea sp.]